MKKTRILGVFVSFLFLISCGGGGSGGSTGGGTDTTAPTVSSTGPADSTTGVSLDALITATFSEAMDVSTITATTFTLNPPVTGVVSYDTATNTATFTPSGNLAESTTYTAMITQGVKDSAGNSMAADYIWSFTTADTTAPTVLSTDPADTATGVSLDALITATFREAMDVSTITATTFTLNPPVAGTVSYDAASNTATFTPSSNLAASTTHTATITQGVKDSAGNNMAADFTWSFTTADVAGDPVDLPETGQQTCYDATGAVIACPGTGQDGDLLAGISWPAPRFMDNGDGTITDNLTGLMWLQDANCMSTEYPAFDIDNISGDGSVPWEKNLTFVSGINDGTYANCAAGYTDWRIPNVNELESLVNAEQSNSATWLIGEGFTNVETSLYWTSTTYAGSSASVWHVQMWFGFSLQNTKTINIDRYLWPVRATTTLPAKVWKTGQTTSYLAGDDGESQTGATWPSPRYTDNGDGTITDKLTKLTWAQDANAPGPVVCTTGVTMTWQDALDYVACLNTNSYLGFSDWRLPNRKEIRSLIDYSQTTPALPPGHPFSNVQLTIYWISTTYAEKNSSAWEINMNTGSIFFQTKTTLNFVWPVR